MARTPMPWDKNYPDTFSTRIEAEREIAKRDLAGIKKAHHNLSRWRLVDNPSGNITLSQFIQCTIVEAERLGQRMRPAEAAVFASKIWRKERERRQQKWDRTVAKISERRNKK